MGGPGGGGRPGEGSRGGEPLPAGTGHRPAGLGVILWLCIIQTQGFSLFFGGVFGGCFFYGHINCCPYPQCGGVGSEDGWGLGRGGGTVAQPAGQVVAEPAGDGGA